MTIYVPDLGPAPEPERNGPKRWTPEEDAIIAERYPIGSWRGAAKHLVGRTQHAIQRRASILGIRLAGPTIRTNSWTEKEDRAIRECYPNGGAPKAAMSLSGRTPGAIACRASRLGVRTLHRGDARPLWTREDDELLRQHYSSGGPRAAASVLPHRTIAAIKSRAGVLCLKSNAPSAWAPKEEAVLRNELDRRTYREIAELLGKTMPSVKNKAQALGLRKRSE